MNNRMVLAGEEVSFAGRSPITRGPNSGYERSALILAGDGHAIGNLPSLVEKCGLNPVCLSSVGELRTGALDDRATLILCEDVLPDGDFRDAIRVVTAAARKIPVIVFSRIADWDSYLRAVRLGAYDCMRYPFRSGELQWILKQIISAPPSKA